MTAHKRTFLEKLGYIFAPADADGLGFFDRLFLTLHLGDQKAWLARPEVPAEKQLIDTVEALCARMHIDKLPKIFILDSPVPNAASVVGGSIVINTNSMQILEANEMEALLAHELSHHRHAGRDVPVTLGLPWAYNIGSAVMRSKIGANLDKQLAFSKVDSVGLIATNRLIPMAWMRRNEFEADFEAALATNPKYMSAALEVLEKRIAQLVPPRLNAMRMKDSYFSTHPPTPRRLDLLKRMEKHYDRLEDEPSKTTLSP
jgi:heat shock protein HtpX